MSRACTKCSVYSFALRRCKRGYAKPKTKKDKEFCRVMGFQVCPYQK